MGEARRRKLAVAAGEPDPGPTAPTPNTYRWGEQQSLEAALIARHLDSGGKAADLPKHLHPMAVKLLRLGEKARRGQKT